MKNRLLKATLLSMAAVGLGVTAFVAAPSNANAKSYAKVKSNKAFSITYSERNYLPSGSAALYTKAGTLKGARKVASAATLRRLASLSDKGQSYFRAYRIARTNRGSYYLKVTSFDKTYRGWIYAGKSNPSGKTSVGGMKKVSTFNRGSVSTDIANATYYFGTTSSTTYKEPDWTQYKVGRNMASVSGEYAKDALRVTGVGTKTNGRDNNATYYYVEDSSHPTINGWIKASYLTSGGTGAASSSSSTKIGTNQVLVNYIDSATNSSVTTKLLTNTNATSQTAPVFVGNNSAGQAYSNIPSGYSAPGDSTTYGTKNTTALAAAQYGQQVNYYVVNTSTDNLFATAPKYTTYAASRTWSGLAGDPVSKNAYITPGAKTDHGTQLNTLLAQLAKASATSGNNGQNQTFTAQNVFDALHSVGLDDYYYLTYLDPLSGKLLDGGKNQAILTASSTGTPSVAGLFGLDSNSNASSSDVTSQISNIISATGADPIGSLLSGLGGALANGLNGVANFLFGGTIYYRVVHVTTNAADIQSANGNSIKMGSQVTIPYTAEASNAIKQDAVKNNLSSTFSSNEPADKDKDTVAAKAFTSKSFQSSSSSLAGLLNSAGTAGTSTSSSSSALTANTASSDAATGSSNWLSTLGNALGFNS